MARLADIMRVDVLRCATGNLGPTTMKPKQPMGKPQAGNNNPNGPQNTSPGRSFQQDNTDLDGPSPQSGMQPNSNIDPQQDPNLNAAPYIKLLSKLGYEYQGQDEDMQGMPIAHSFNGQDGDMIMVKPDGSWNRFGPGAQKSSGKDVPSLGQNLVRDSLQQGDDANPHSALRQAGYSKFHTDDQGNSYYKHPQTGNTVTVNKQGNWQSSTGSGRGAQKLRGFLGDEQMNNQDPQMQQVKLKQQQMKQQQQGMQQQQMGKPPGTRGQGSTRGGIPIPNKSMKPRAPGMGGRGGF